MIESMFSVNVFKDTIDTISYDLMHELKNEVLVNVSDDAPGASSVNKQYQYDKRLSFLFEIIQLKLKEAWVELDFRKDLKPHLTESWVNVIRKKGIMEDVAHHSKFQLYGVLHLHVPENSGDLVINHPFDGLPRNLAYEPKPNLTKYKMTPKVGDLIIVPSSCTFMHTENKSGEDKVTLEFGCWYNSNIA